MSRLGILTLLAVTLVANACAITPFSSPTSSLNKEFSHFRNKRIGFRVIEILHGPYDSITRVESMPGFEGNLGDSLRKLGSDPINIPFQPIGEFLESELEKRIPAEFPNGVDYFLDVKVHKPMHYGQIMVYWGVFHLASLGFIPMKITNYFDIKVTMFDRKGRIARKFDKYSNQPVWAWTPLFLFNGFKMFSSFEKTIAESNRPTFDEIAIESMSDGATR